MQNQFQQDIWKAAQGPWESSILPSTENLVRARASLPAILPDTGSSLESVQRHIVDDIVPAFNGGSLSANYYGFITGGTTPAALFADNVVSTYDQNVQVHLPNHSIVTDVEYNTLGLLLDLFQLDRSTWHNGTFTTGATGAAQRKGCHLQSVGEEGLFKVLNALGLSGVQVLSTLPHSSLVKAAGVLGIGRSNVHNICRADDPLRFDIDKLEKELARTDKYGAWMHADGAFGIFARVLGESPEFATIKKGCEGIELVDSITGDGHKLLNVPYDCGFFFTRHPNVASQVFQNANAAYLAAGNSDGPSIPSPLNIGIENSRRFRALPVYASLLSYGKSGYQEMLERQIRLARKIYGWVFDHPGYTALPEALSKSELLDRTFMTVLLRANNEDLNRELGSKINDSSRMFVSGTSWDGSPACRIAISNWRVDVERDFLLVTDVLAKVAQG
ncbi:Pyridoxal phosphate-dependent transferase major region subdomain 2 [Penicillium expansum]|nr:Pyridoxal phosphate-dependent transferase major region subdomain 2 [Penicillium expansum]